LCEGSVRGTAPDPGSRARAPDGGSAGSGVPGAGRHDLSLRDRLPAHVTSSPTEDVTVHRQQRRGPMRTPAKPRRRGRKILRAVLSAALVGAIFGFALPRFASYHSVWASLRAMAWPQVALVAGTAAVSMISVWFMICSVLPSIRLRQAAVVNLGSNSVANTLPAGGALAMGVSWAMLSSWGVGTAEYVLYTLVSGVWNVLARLGLPVLALLVLMTAARPGALLIAAAAVGLALLAVV